jgi:hypothetical protein
MSRLPSAFTIVKLGLAASAAAQIVFDFIAGRLFSFSPKWPLSSAFQAFFTVPNIH